MSILNFIIDNSDTIFDVLFSIFATAKIITATTETPADDKFVGKVYKIVEMIALVTNKTKMLPKNKVE